MSRRRRRPQSNRSVIVEQAQPQEQRAARQPNIKPGATNYKPLTSFTPLSDAVIAQMYQNMGPQANQDAMYSPGAPLRPVPGLVPKEGPRGFDYTTGYNIGQLPRSTEIYSFADLRALSTMYYGIQMCQQVWFDYISQLELDITPIPSLIGEDGDISMYEDDIETYKEFFAYPDKDHDLHSWIQMAVKDQLEIDAVAIYPRKDRAGRLYSLDLIDAQMVKPLVDDRGRKPQAPFPAYEQFVHGVPACLLTSDDLIYIKETERTDSVYGRSRTERIILNINVALRKQTKDLAHFTDGTLPPGFISPTMDVQWSQEEIEAWEMQLNNVMAGNDELRARLKVLPRGFEYKAVTDSDDIHMELDQFILNVAAACHGLTMAELAFTDDVNRSTGDSQENVVYRRAMGPLMKRYARLFTMILQKYFGEKRFIVSFKGYEENEDTQAQAATYAQLVGAGILGLTNAAKLLKLPEEPDAPYIGRVFMGKDGPVFLDDMANPAMRDAQNAAKLAGFDMAANPQLQQPVAGSDALPEEASGGKSEGEKESPAVARLMAQVQEILTRLDRAENLRPQVVQQMQRSAQSDELDVFDDLLEEELPNDDTEAQQAKTNPTAAEYGEQAQGAASQTGERRYTLAEILHLIEKQAQARDQAEVQTESRRVASPEQSPEPGEASLDYRRWKSRAIDDVKAQRTMRPFASTLIPTEMHMRIARELEECRTIGDVRVVFDRAKESV